MRKAIIITLATLATVRRLFAARNRIGAQEALAPHGEVKPVKKEPPPISTSTIRKQRRREAIEGRGQRRRLQARKRDKRSYGLLIVKSTIKWSFAALSVAGSVVGIDSYRSSRILISPIQSDPNTPFSPAFSVTNDGFLAVYNVRATCDLPVVQSERGIMRNSGGHDGTADADELPSGDTTTLRCFGGGIFLPGALQNGEAIISVSYNPKFYPWTKVKQARFVGERRSDGSLQWLQKPLIKNQ